jgi:hypothetical protein
VNIGIVGAGGKESGGGEESVSTPVVGMRGLVLMILPPIIMPSLPISLSAERMFSNAMIAWRVPGIVVTRSMGPKWLKTS